MEKLNKLRKNAIKEAMRSSTVREFECALSMMGYEVVRRDLMKQLIKGYFNKNK